MNNEQKLLKTLEDNLLISNYLKTLSTKYYLQNKNFVKTATDINEIVTSFNHWLNINKDKVYNMLANNFDNSIDSSQVVDEFINIIIKYVNNDNELLLKYLRKYINVSININQYEKDKYNKIVDAINNIKEYDNEILINTIQDYEAEIKNKKIKAKTIITNKFKAFKIFTKKQWINFIATYVTNQIKNIDDQKQDEIINIFINKLKEIITVENVQFLIDQYIIYNSSLNELVYKNKNDGKTLSDYTNVGIEYLKQIYNIAKNIIDNDDKFSILIPIMYNLKNTDPEYNYRLEWIIYDLIRLGCAAYMKNINNDWSPREISDFIYNGIINIINSKLKKYYKSKSDNTLIFTKIIKAIQHSLPLILPNIEFKKSRSGYYRYSWLDSHLYTRFDANPVLRYIKKDKAIANHILKEALNCTVDEFTKYFPLTWHKFVTLLSENPIIIEKLHLAVRKYIVNLNKDIVLQKSNEINNKDDIDKIINIGENDELTSKNNDTLNDNDKLVLDFNPRDDSQRERPLVVIREYLSNDKNDYNDHIIIGRKGANHGSILNNKKYDSLLQRSIFPGASDPTFACAYVIGKICVIDNLRGAFPSVAAIRDSIKKSNKFSKIYIMPTDDPKIIYRVARKIK